MDKGSCFGQFWKLGFCTVRECPIFAHGGQLLNFLNHECVVSVPTWNMPKHACMTHQNLVLMHGFHSMSRLGIQEVSLKACGRWDSMCHRMMTVAWIDELMDPLVLGHRDSARVALYSESMDKGSFCFVNFGNYGFAE